MKDAKYLMAFSVPLSVFISIYFREIFSYTSTLYVFLFIPIVELFLPTHLSTFSEQESKSRLKDKFFDWLLYLNVPIVYLILFYGLYSFANYDLHAFGAHSRPLLYEQPKRFDVQMVLIFVLMTMPVYC